MISDPQDAGKAQRDLYWGMFTDLRSHARHAETLRANAVALTVVVCSALVALITSEQTKAVVDRLLAVGISVVGGFGIIFSLLYTELFERNRTRAIFFRKHLDRECFDENSLSTQQVLDEADAVHHKRRLWFGRRRISSARNFWLAIPAILFIGGILLTVYQLVQPVDVEQDLQPSPSPVVASATPSR